jgi:hypothetical protein
MPAEARCPTCGGPLIQKPRWRLVLAALAFLVVSMFLFRTFHGFRVVLFTLGLTGCYLMAWALIGKGRWCRQCKRFPIA